MMIEQFLENLNFREKILLYIGVFLLAIFVSFTFYDSYIKAFFQYDFSAEDRSIYKNLNHDIEELEQKRSLLQEKLSLYENYLNFFNKSYEEYIHNIYELAFDNKVKIKNLQKIKEDDMKKYTILLTIHGNFNQMLSFMHSIENSKFNYQIDHIKMDNASSLDLLLSTTISFLALKAQ